MFTNPIGKIVTVSILISLLLLTSCASNYQTIKPRPDGLQSHITKGDTVEILTKSGRILTFKVVGISDSALKGDNLQVPYTEIVEIKKMLTEREIRQKSLKNAAIGLVFAAVVGGLMIYMLLQWDLT